MKNFTASAILLILFAGCSSHLSLESPSGKTNCFITSGEKNIQLILTYDEDTILRQANLAISEMGTQLLEIKTLKRKSVDYVKENWETINGKNKQIINHYNTAIYEIHSVTQRTINLEIRVYDQGFAYRFLLPDNPDQFTEKTTFNFADDLTFWSYNGEHHNVGPVTLSQHGSKAIRQPVTFETPKDTYLALHEAAIFDHAPFELDNLPDENRIELTQVMNTHGEPTKSSWRAFILGDTPGELIESNLLVNLNEPCKIEDPSWIKPGRAMWDWRVWGYTAPDGFTYGLNTISHKRFIDFAAQNNVQYLLLDADWYGPEFSEESDPTTTREGIDIEECMAYAKEKQVGIILYLNDVGAKKYGLERILKQFSEWGASGVKYGFMQGDWEQKVKNTRRIVELCAQYRLTVNFHDNPVPPSGDRRTWPNLITKEFGHSQADAKRSYYPETIVTAPFVNMLAGPLDLCNGWFSLNTAYGNGRVKVFEEIPGTVAAEVAKLIVVYGGMFILPDAPEEYLKKDDLFDCIRNMPAHFDRYDVLDGEIGEFICVARRAGDDWFIGSLTNRESRNLDIDFGFLDEDAEYKATFYEDAEDTHFLTNKEAYQVRNENAITSESRVRIQLAPGGGNSIWLHRVN